VQIAEKKIARYSSRCPNCAHVFIRKVKRPDMEVLRKELAEFGWEAIGKKYGVSGNSVRKWIYIK
jgi:hypothetical protein